MVTRPNELPPVPTVVAGSSVSDAGCGCGSSVSLACARAPFHVAVTVAVVFCATAVVCSANEVEKLPPLTNTDGGGVTADESLVNETRAPPGGAWPVSMTIAPGCAPPLIVLGEIVNDFSAAGVTVS